MRIIGVVAMLGVGCGSKDVAVRSTSSDVASPTPAPVAESPVGPQAPPPVLGPAAPPPANAPRTAGVLGTLSPSGTSVALLGADDINAGFADDVIYGGPGDPVAGLGMASGTGSVGTGGSASGIGHGGGSRSKPACRPSTSIGQPTARGELDRAIIRRYIQRNIAKLQYCYEKELLVKTSLAGTVTAQFAIGHDGSVTSARADGVDASVASCVAGAIKGIQFPAPKGGGAVQVSYPFTFRSEHCATTRP